LVSLQPLSSPSFLIDSLVPASIARRQGGYSVASFPQEFSRLRPQVKKNLRRDKKKWRVESSTRHFRCWLAPLKI